jgi:hypothetical protein
MTTVHQALHMFVDYRTVIGRAEIHSDAESSTNCRPDSEEAVTSSQHKVDTSHNAQAHPDATP